MQYELKQVLQNITMIVKKQTQAPDVRVCLMERVTVTLTDVILTVDYIT